MDGCHRPRAGEFVGVPTFSRNLMNRTDFSRARISEGKLFVFALPVVDFLSVSLFLVYSLPWIESFINETQDFP